MLNSPLDGVVARFGFWYIIKAIRTLIIFKNIAYHLYKISIVVRIVGFVVLRYGSPKIS